MKTKHLLKIAIGAASVWGLASIGANAALIQTVAGPVSHTGGGVGATILDTSNDTGDWMDDLTSANTFFIGFDYTINDNNSGGYFGGLGLYDGGVESSLFGNRFGGTEYGANITGGSTGGDAGVTYTVGNTVRIVFEMSTVGGSTANDDTWNMWIDPSASDLGSPLIGGTDAEFDGVDQFTVRAGNGTAESTIANLRVSSSFAASIPEPSGPLLIGLGGLSLLLRRRAL